MSGYQLDPTQSQFSDALTQHIRQTFVDMLTDPTSLPADFKSWLPKYLETNPPLLPISQVFGFSQSTARSATQVQTQESTTSTTYTNLTTTGPQLTGLPSGQYLLLYGSACFSDAVGTSAILSVSINSAAPSENDRALNSTGSQVSIIRATTASLTAGSNTVLVQYKVGTAAHTVNFADRWLVAFRYANL